MSDTKALIKYVRDRLNDGPNITFGKPTVLDLVEALEASEGRAEKAEAENDRLTKMVDWLADKLSDHCLADGGDCNIPICPTYIACRNATPKVWKEAASRAVAAGEETCQK